MSRPRDTRGANRRGSTLWGDEMGYRAASDKPARVKPAPAPAPRLVSVNPWQDYVLTFQDGSQCRVTAIGTTIALAQGVVSVAPCAE